MKQATPLTAVKVISTVIISAFALSYFSAAQASTTKHYYYNSDNNQYGTYVSDIGLATIAIARKIKADPKQVKLKSAGKKGHFTGYVVLTSTQQNVTASPAKGGK